MSISQFKTFLLQKGFNVIETTTSKEIQSNKKNYAELEAQFPGFQSLILIGNGGPLLWHHYSKWLNRENGNNYIDPLDKYTKNCILESRKILDPQEKESHVIYPFYKEKKWFNFQTLSLAMKIACPSPFQLVLHPKFGPWFSLRGLILLKGDFSEHIQPMAWNPCPTCPAPCIDICPAKAAERNHFNWNACSNHRSQKESSCKDRCLSREACPIHPEEKFPRDEITYHYTF